MAKILIILLFGLMCEAVGVVFLDQGLKPLGELQKVGLKEIGGIVKLAISSRSLQLGVFFEAVFFACLLVLMSQGAGISFIWPLTALGFVLTTLAARFVLHEEVSLLRWAGVSLILLGAALVIWSEKTVPKKTAPPVARVEPSPH